MTVVRIDFIDHDTEFGFFGKRVASTTVEGMTEEEITKEIKEMQEHVGDHCAVVFVERI